MNVASIRPLFSVSTTVGKSVKRWDSKRVAWLVFDARDRQKSDGEHLTLFGRAGGSRRTVVGRGLPRSGAQQAEDGNRRHSANAPLCE
jgi:hypothetical protein